MESLSNNVVDLKACNVIKKRLQHRCFSENIAKPFKSIYFQIFCKRLVLPLEVFCIRNLLIVAMRMLHLAYKPYEVFFIGNLLILAMRMLHLAYKEDCNCIFNYNCILASEISFSDTRKLCSIYRSNRQLWKIHGIA